MDLDWLPPWGFFVATIVIVMGFYELGYRLGRSAHRASEEEKEVAASGVSGAVLGLSAFFLAFTFSIVTERYQDRKGLVREDADAIRVAWARADFLPEPDRTESKRLLSDYLDKRIAFAEARATRHELAALLSATDAVHRRLWQIAVANAERDMNSDVAALYIESLNELAVVQTARLAKARARVPMAVWLTLASLTILGMLSMGYHTGLADSKRSKSTTIVAVSFGMVIALIGALDRPESSVVSQQPLLDLQGFIAGK